LTISLPKSPDKRNRAAHLGEIQVRSGSLSNQPKIEWGKERAAPSERPGRSRRQIGSAPGFEKPGLAAAVSPKAGLTIFCIVSKSLVRVRFAHCGNALLPCEIMNKQKSPVAEEINNRG